MSSNHRASLLSGLRTGGVRTASNPSHLQMNGPYTAAIGGQFPRHASFGANFEDDGSDQLAASMAQKLNFGGGMPMTASAAESGLPMFQQQQHAQALYLQAQAQAAQFAAMSGQSAFNNGMTPEQAQNFQMQMEFLRLQAVQQQQQQQFQAQMMAQAQMQQQALQSQRRRTSEPNTAGPLTTSFGNPQIRARPSQTFANTFGVGVAEAEAPMSAAINGRFGNRAVSSLNPNATSFVAPKIVEETAPSASVTSGNWRSGTAAPTTTPATPSYTTVISGGTSLGQPTPPKHDTATSWRRASATPSMIAAHMANKSPSPPPRSARSSPSSSPPPTLLVSAPDETSPPTSRSISPPSPVLPKTRPQALRFSVSVTNPQQLKDIKADHQILLDGGDNQAQVVIVNSDYDEDSDSCTPTPTTGSSSQSVAREEATKRLYEGLGIGRPAPVAAPVSVVSRQVSQPARQPRGPPSGVEDLGARNFATRIRRKAIGGLGALMDARGRRESLIIEAY